MSRKDKNKKVRGPLTPKSKPPEMGLSRLTAMLNLWAPAIEALGSYQRAKELRVIDGFGINETQFLSIVPKSRGGTLEGPEVDADWQGVVSGALESRGTTLEALREGYKLLASQ
jgi:hypothetical protein